MSLQAVLAVGDGTYRIAAVRFVRFPVAVELLAIDPRTHETVVDAIELMTRTARVWTGGVWAVRDDGVAERIDNNFSPERRRHPRPNAPWFGSLPGVRASHAFRAVQRRLESAGAVRPLSTEPG